MHSTRVSDIFAATHRRRRAEPSTHNDMRKREEAQLSRRQRIKKAVARNVDLPSMAGMLIQSWRGILGGESEIPRWVVIEPREGILSLWDQQPAAAEAKDLGTQFNWIMPSFAMKARAVFTDGAPAMPRKVFSLESLKEVDYNPFYHNIFLQFEGVANVLVLTSPGCEDFQRWKDLLVQYDARSDEKSKLTPKAAQVSL